jgi:hypothetical protein
MAFAARRETRSLASAASFECLEVEPGFMSNSVTTKREMA